MIKLEDLTPKIYYKQSRDFQYIGRLFDLVLNKVKTDTDLIYYLPLGLNSNIDSINLLSTTLGFQKKHNYNSVQLKAICGVLPLILKNKGSLNALIIATNAILHSEGIIDQLEYSFINNELTLLLPAELSDNTLIVDLLDYILPAGICCSIINAYKVNTEVETKIIYADTAAVHLIPSDVNSDTNSIAALADIENDLENILKPYTDTTGGISGHSEIQEFNSAYLGTEEDND